MTLSWLASAMSRMRTNAGSLAVEQMLPLDARRRLCVVRCEGRRVLLLIGGSQDLVVGWLDEPATGQPAP